MRHAFTEQCLRYILKQHRDNNAPHDFIRQLEQLLGIPYSDEPSEGENLCFADSHVVRPEYKTSFSTGDLRNYISNHPGPQNADLSTHLITIMPISKQAFWNTVYPDISSSWCDWNVIRFTLFTFLPELIILLSEWLATIIDNNNNG